MNTLAQPRLYIIMRSDLWDMNPGKGMAQAAHAQALFDLHMGREAIANDLLERYAFWRGDGEDSRGFGTTTVLSAPGNPNNDVLHEIVQRVQHSGRVVDPTYPYRNYYGELFTCPAVTCAWAFPMTDDEHAYLRYFDLHK